MDRVIFEMESMKKVRVLLATESDNSFVLIQEMLERFPNCYELDWATNFEMAIEKVFNNKYDACLVSYKLGVRSGTELISQITMNNIYFPTVLLTHEENENSISVARKSGACDCLAEEDITPVLLDRVLKYAVELKRREKELVELAHTDPLTGIANRKLFLIRLKDAIALAARNNCLTAIIALDVDNFKQINDTLGHQAGDLLLTGLAERLQNATRESDILARLGGDEFAIVATNINKERDVVAVAQRILKSIETPIPIDKMEMKVNAHIGIALCPGDGETAEIIVKHADEALYQAKSLQKGPYHFFNKDMHQRRIEAQKFEKDLHNSLNEQELSIEYQPIIDLSSGVPVSAEALVRWKHPEKGMIPPDQFINIAEKTGYISSLGGWVLRTACEMCSNLVKLGHKDFTVAVNVSLAQIIDGDFIEFLQDIVLEAGISYE